METTPENNTPDAEDLSGIPGVGPARRAALIAAGITTRAALARASVEQLVSMTGMARAQAERTLAVLRQDGESAAATTTPALSPVPLTDEALPTEDGMPAAAEEPAPAEERPLTDLERAIFAARTALADVTRLLTGPRLEKSLTRFATLLEALPARAAKLPARRQKRLMLRLRRITIRLERAVSRAGRMTEKREKRLRDRLREERRLLTEETALRKSNRRR